MARDHHDLGVLPSLAQLSQSLQAVDPREPDVQQDGVEWLLVEDPDPLFTAFDTYNLKPLVAQDVLQRGPHPRLVIHDQNPFVGHALIPSLDGQPGNSMMKRAPCGSFSSTRIVPP